VTQPGYHLAVILFAALVFVGAVLALPTKAELGLTETMACDTFLARPSSMDDVRLTGCELDAEGVREHPRDRDAVLVPIVHHDERHELFWVVTAEHAPELAERRRACPDDDGCWRRWVARHPSAIPQGDVVGTVIRVEAHDDAALDAQLAPYEADLVFAPELERAFGVVVSLLGLLGLALVLSAQRRWSARRAELSSGRSSPRVF
jgi:hypothetical protein